MNHSEWEWNSSQLSYRFVPIHVMYPLYKYIIIYIYIYVCVCLDMIPLRTSKLQKLLVSSYLVALSGPVCVCESCYHMQAQTHIHTYFNPWSESRAGGHGSIHQSVANEATDVWRGYAVWSTARTCESNCWFLFLYDAVCFKKEFHISYCLLYYLH